MMMIYISKTRCRNEYKIMNKKYMRKFKQDIIKKKMNAGGFNGIRGVCNK